MTDNGSPETGVQQMFHRDFVSTQIEKKTYCYVSSEGLGSLDQPDEFRGFVVVLYISFLSRRASPNFCQHQVVIIKARKADIIRPI